MMDYEKLGFKCGIEIHNRLATEHKLFCKCPPRFSAQEPFKVIKRNLRPAAGELGQVDIAAMYEYLRKRDFFYQCFEKESCLVECDAEPPHHVNREALHVALQICKLLKCKIPDEAQVMRKTVIDGSNTSGFQRTILIGLDGTLQTSLGPIKITNVCLEEESAGIVNQENGKVTYRLDRLGIPLIEIGTSPQIQSPEHAKEVAEKIGMLVRSTGKSQRGIGVTRQDINVSIQGGARIEIKGVQELEDIPEIIENEVKRQLSLIKLKEKTKNLKISKKIYDVSHIFKNSASKIVKGKKVLAFILSGFAGLLKTELYPNKHLGSELADYARAYGTKGMIHSDEELEKYKLEKEFENLRTELKANQNDCIVIIAGPNAEQACKAVLERAQKIGEGVPEETRIAKGTGTVYTRPLPGGERMYPETDVTVSYTHLTLPTKA